MHYTAWKYLCVWQQESAMLSCLCIPSSSDPAAFPGVDAELRAWSQLLSQVGTQAPGHTNPIQVLHSLSLTGARLFSILTDQFLEFNHETFFLSLGRSNFLPGWYKDSRGECVFECLSTVNVCPQQMSLKAKCCH